MRTSSSTTSAADRFQVSSPPGRARVLVLAALAVLGVWLARRLTPAPGGVQSVSGRTMGTTYTVQFVGDRAADLEAAIHAALDRVNELMSTYDSTSEVSRFNAHRTATPFTASPATLEVVTLAQSIARATGGAFDITVGPLVDAWGFGTAQPRAHPPSSAELQLIRGWVGYGKVRVDATGTLTKDHPRTVIDLSAIAKGYAVDRVAAVLEEHGIDRYLVEVGGELRAHGAKAGGEPWRIGIELPITAGRRVGYTIDLDHGAIATSGDYRNFYELDGTTVTHIIDPRTASPITYAGVAVSVIADDAATADAWATALTVLGVHEGRAVAQREGVGALFIVRREGAFEAYATSGFPEIRPVDPEAPPAVMR